MWNEMYGKIFGTPDAARDVPKAPMPVLWLLGKTGAGKSSLVHALTGLPAAEVGDGFTPCTRTAMAFDHPPDHPVMRFLDTRGISEAGYDPSEDLKVCESGSHAVLVVARLDDPVQGELAEVLRRVRKRRPGIPMLLIHTGADLVPDAQQRARTRGTTQKRLEEAVGGKLSSVELSLAVEPDDEGLDALIDLLSTVLPEAALFLQEEEAADEETRQYLTHRALIFRYAGTASASDALPVVGAVSVPAVQGRMLYKLAQGYGVTWDKTTFGAFATALGSSALLRYGAGVGLRQIGKLIPVFGQTVGAAAAASVSFAATVALGRAAAFWFYRQSRGEPVDTEELRRKYAEALRTAGHGNR